MQDAGKDVDNVRLAYKWNENRDRQRPLPISAAKIYEKFNLLCDIILAHSCRKKDIPYKYKAWGVQ